MLTMKRLGMGLLTVVLAISVAGAADKDQWLHVAVDGTSDDSERVRVNVPLSLVEVVLPLIEEEGFSHGQIRIDDMDFSQEDLVELLSAVSEAEDGEYITFEDEYESVRVSKKDGYVIVNVTEEGRRRTEQVDVRIPVDVLDALISGEDGELDLLAGIEALSKHGDTDLVTVNEDGTSVRIWIDSENLPNRGD